MGSQAIATQRHIAVRLRHTCRYVIEDWPKVVGFIGSNTYPVRLFGACDACHEVKRRIYNRFRWDQQMLLTKAELLILKANAIKERAGDGRNRIRSRDTSKTG